MKVYCKRTYLSQNNNYYPINGKRHGEYWVVWKRGNYYNIKHPLEHEKEVGIHYIVESERESFWTPIKEKEFRKYFIDIDELRNKKINKILDI
jgi:hypothetical protein